MNASHQMIDPADSRPDVPPQGVERLRVPPYSAEAEQSLLGSLMQDNGCMAAAVDLVNTGSFYSAAHRHIFGAIEALLSERKPADVITVFEYLRAAGVHDDDFGGLAYIHKIDQCVPSARNAKRYAELVAERAVERALIAGLDQASTIAWQSSEPLQDRMERIQALMQGVAQQRNSPGLRRVPLLSLAALRDESQAVRWLVKGALPAEAVGMLYGGSGTFKSFIALDAALHIAHGLTWMGRKTVKGPVIYIAAEGGSGLWPRIEAWHKARGLDWRSAQLHVVPAAIDLGADAWRVVDAAQMLGVVPVLVVVDTLSQTYSGEENSAQEMAAYLRELGTRFRSLWHCAVMLIHHSGHQATERPRGSSAIRANLDFMLGVFRDEKEMMATLSCQKMKDASHFEDATFSLSVSDLGRDDDGDRVTSLVARHLSTSEDVSTAMEAEGKAGRGGKNQLLLTLLQNGSKESDLRKAFYEQCGLDSADHRRQAYFRAMKWAKEKGFAEISEGYVLVTKAKG